MSPGPPHYHHLADVWEEILMASTGISSCGLRMEGAIGTNPIVKLMEKPCTSQWIHPHINPSVTILYLLERTVSRSLPSILICISYISIDPSDPSIYWLIESLLPDCLPACLACLPAYLPVGCWSVCLLTIGWTDGLIYLTCRNWIERPNIQSRLVQSYGISYNTALLLGGHHMFSGQTQFLYCAYHGIDVDKSYDATQFCIDQLWNGRREEWR